MFFVVRRNDAEDESILELPDLEDSNVDLAEFLMKNKRRRVFDAPLFNLRPRPMSPFDIQFVKPLPPTTEDAAADMVDKTQQKPTEEQQNGTKLQQRRSDKGAYIFIYPIFVRRFTKLIYIQLRLGCK